MDLTSPQTIRYIKNKYGFNTSKGLGQNFLCDSGVIAKITEAAQLGTDIGALEIGPGIGVLTSALAGAAKRVVSIELDTRLLPVLDETLAEHDNVTIVNQDVLKCDLPALCREHFSDCSAISLAANLPYYITTPILTSILENNELDIGNIVVMVQKEVGYRLCAAPGCKDYSALTVLVAYHSHAEIITTVPAASFMPPPKVDSAVVRLTMYKGKKAVAPVSEKLFFQTVKAAFGQRRKTLLNALCGFGGFGLSKDAFREIIVGLGWSENVRGEQLGQQEFCALSDKIGAAR